MFALVGVSYEYKLVVFLKELYKVITNVTSILSNGDAQAIIPML